MKVLVIYATNSGSTEICSKVIKETLEKQNHEVKLTKAIDTNPDEIRNYDLVLFGSPSWDYIGKEGMPHEDMIDFLNKLTNANLPTTTKYAVFGCGDRSYAYFCHAVDYMESKLAELSARLAIKSLKIDSFFFDMDRNITNVETWASELSKINK